MRLPLALVLAVGCSTAPGEPACRPGFYPAEDGRCYPPPPDPEPVSATDAIDALPACVPRDEDGLVDLDAGCASGACAGAPAEEWSAALGDDVECAYASWSYDWAYCAWSVGIEGLFPVGAYGEIDPAATSDWVHLLPGYDGATDDGLGVGISPRCWTDALGVPNGAYWVDVSGTLALQDLYWWTPYGVEIHDWDGPDGVVDDVYLFGAG